jgi:hypothetical protein
MKSTVEVELLTTKSIGEVEFLTTKSTVKVELLTTKSIGEVEFLATKSKYILRCIFSASESHQNIFYIFFTLKFGLEFFGRVKFPTGGVTNN